MQSLHRGEHTRLLIDATCNHSIEVVWQVVLCLQLHTTPAMSRDFGGFRQGLFFKLEQIIASHGAKLAYPTHVWLIVTHHCMTHPSHGVMLTWPCSLHDTSITWSHADLALLKFAFNQICCHMLWQADVSRTKQRCMN